MKLTLAVSTLWAITSTVNAFVPASTGPKNAFVCKGYLDDLSDELRAPDSNPDIEGESKDKTNLSADKVDRGGVGDWSGFVDFEEFDGGDGQMGVAGDGKKGLQKEWEGETAMAKSKFRSAKNAWGRSTGYAETLAQQGVEQSRAQQLENWHNQQDVISARKQQRWMTEEFDQVDNDDNWRKLGTFGSERNQDFDLDKAFGPVTPGENVVTTIELASRVSQNAVFEFDLTNSFMGFSDFRAAFTPDTNAKEWTVTPSEGSLSGKTQTPFSVKYRPSNPGVSEGYLVIDTEDDKWTFKLLGRGSM